MCIPRSTMKHIRFYGFDWAWPPASQIDSSHIDISRYVYQDMYVLQQVYIYIYKYWLLYLQISYNEQHNHDWISPNYRYMYIYIYMCLCVHVEYAICTEEIVSVSGDTHSSVISWSLWSSLLHGRGHFAKNRGDWNRLFFTDHKHFFTFKLPLPRLIG